MIPPVLSLLTPAGICHQDYVSIARMAKMPVLRPRAKAAAGVYVQKYGREHDPNGVLELLVAHGETDPQPLALYKARGAAGNGWLRVRPLTRFEAPARGAVVRAEVGGRVRVKPIDGGSGYLCQMEPVAHFGLGRGGRVDRVTVTWPDGAAVVLEDPGADRTITVPFPRG